MSINIEISGASGRGAAALATTATRASESLTAAATASTSVAQPGEMWTITAEADVFVEFGTAPTGADPRCRMKSGSTRQWFASRVNEKVAFATS